MGNLNKENNYFSSLILCPQCKIHIPKIYIYFPNLEISCICQKRFQKYFISGYLKSIENNNKNYDFQLANLNENCKLHKNLFLDYICLNCNKLLCIRCLKDKKHFKHNYKDLKDYSLYIRNKLLYKNENDLKIFCKYNNLEKSENFQMLSLFYLTTLNSFNYFSHFGYYNINLDNLLEDIITIISCFKEEKTIDYSLNNNINEKEIEKKNNNNSINIESNYFCPFKFKYSFKKTFKTIDYKDLDYINNSFKIKKIIFFQNGKALILMITKNMVHNLKRIYLFSLNPFKFQLSINEDINILNIYNYEEDTFIIISSSNNYSIHIYSLETLKQINFIENVHETLITDLLYIKSKKTLITISKDKTKKWNMNNLTCEFEINIQNDSFQIYLMYSEIYNNVIFTKNNISIFNWSLNNNVIEENKEKIPYLKLWKINDKYFAIFIPGEVILIKDFKSIKTHKKCEFNQSILIIFPIKENFFFCDFGKEKGGLITYKNNNNFQIETIFTFEKDKKKEYIIDGSYIKKYDFIFLYKLTSIIFIRK